MTATARDYALLASTLRIATLHDPAQPALGPWSRYVSSTPDTLDTFRRHSPHWHQPGHRVEVNGGLYWASCQALEWSPRSEVCVVDCGSFRLIYQGIER